MAAGEKGSPAAYGSAGCKFQSRPPIENLYRISKFIDNRINHLETNYTRNCPAVSEPLHWNPEPSPPPICPYFSIPTSKTEPKAEADEDQRSQEQ